MVVALTVRSVDLSRPPITATLFEVAVIASETSTLKDNQDASRIPPRSVTHKPRSIPGKAACRVIARLDEGEKVLREAAKVVHTPGVIAYVTAAPLKQNVLQTDPARHRLDSC